MMGNRIDIPSVYDDVRKAYAGMGYPVAGDRLVVSEQPTYVDGRPVPKDVIKPNSSGGNTQDDGTVRINPRYRAVMRHWGLKGSGRDFLRTIIGHELGHHVDRTVLGGRSAERRRLLQEIADSGFHTVYTDSYGSDTDRRKLDKELLAEYLAKQVSDRLGKSSEDDIEAKARLHYPAEGSHGWNHIQDVLANARRMRRRELRRNELAAIMYHDSSLMTGNRETHADDSAEIARKELAGLFRRRQLEDIVNAIAHHRASYEGARGSRLEDLVAAADRPVPDLSRQVARSWKYHEELGEPEGLRAENVASHLKEKYGRGGYAYGNAPKLYLRAYGKALRDVMSRFDVLTPESVASMMSGTPEKKAELRDGTYDDVKAVYDALSDREKDLVTPGRTVYKDVPVLSRTVAYDGDAPVGFADWYGKKGRASLCVAVSDRARGQGLAGKMAIDSIRKILARIRAEREQAEREGGDALREWRGRSRLRNFVWGLAAGNDASARAAEKAGFRERLFKRLHNGRRFVLSRADAEKLVDPDSSGKES